MRLQEVLQVRKQQLLGSLFLIFRISFIAELARGIEDIATMYKYNIILSNSDENTDKEFRSIEYDARETSGWSCVYGRKYYG